jgi:hypothetical protein
MDFVGMMHLGKIRHDELLREAEQTRRFLRSLWARRLPKLVQVLILILH